jgi:hypothetical protein
MSATRTATASYTTYDVLYEHTTADSDTVRQNRAIVTVYGRSELKLKAAIEHERPSNRNVTILDSRRR